MVVDENYNKYIFFDFHEHVFRSLYRQFFGRAEYEKFISEMLVKFQNQLLINNLDMMAQDRCLDITGYLYKLGKHFEYKDYDEPRWKSATIAILRDFMRTKHNLHKGICDISYAMSLDPVTRIKASCTTNDKKGLEDFLNYYSAMVESKEAQRIIDNIFG